MKLGIFGAGGLGRETAELAKIIDKWDELFFIDDSIVNRNINDLSVYTLAEVDEKFNKTNFEIIIAIGEPITKIKVYERLYNKGYNFATLIHPEIEIPKSTIIGKDVIIQKSIFIGPNVIISDNVLLQPYCVVGHDSKIGQFSVISTFVTVCGMVNIGDNTFIGVNSCIKQGVEVGSNTIIGMGSVVVRNIPDNIIAMGNPARPMKEKNESRALK